MSDGSSNSIETVTLLGDVPNIKTLCEIWNQLITDKSLILNSDLRLFREGITPQWEDPANIGGGRYMIPFLNKEGSDESVAALETFLKLAVLLVAGQAGYEKELSGIGVASRSFGYNVSVWNQNATSNIDFFVGRLSAILHHTEIRYKPHRESISSHLERKRIMEGGIKPLPKIRTTDVSHSGSASEPTSPREGSLQSPRRSTSTRKSAETIPIRGKGKSMTDSRDQLNKRRQKPNSTSNSSDRALEIPGHETKLRSHHSSESLGTFRSYSAGALLHKKEIEAPASRTPRKPRSPRGSQPEELPNDGQGLSTTGPTSTSNPSEKKPSPQPSPEPRRALLKIPEGQMIKKPPGSPSSRAHFRRKQAQAAQQEQLLKSNKPKRLKTRSYPVDESSDENSVKSTESQDSEDEEDLYLKSKQRLLSQLEKKRAENPEIPNFLANSGDTAVSLSPKSFSEVLGVRETTPRGQHTQSNTQRPIATSTMGRAKEAGQGRANNRSRDGTQSRGTDEENVNKNLEPEPVRLRGEGRGGQIRGNNRDPPMSRATVAAVQIRGNNRDPRELMNVQPPTIYPKQNIHQQQPQNVKPIQNPNPPQMETQMKEITQLNRSKEVDHPIEKQPEVLPSQINQPEPPLQPKQIPVSSPVRDEKEPFQSVHQKFLNSQLRDFPEDSPQILKHRSGQIEHSPYFVVCPNWLVYILPALAFVVFMLKFK